MSDWKGVIESRVEALTSYRSDSNWLMAETPLGDPSQIDASFRRAKQKSWKPVQLPTELTERAEFWFRLVYVVPADMCGVSVSGTKITLQSRTLAPIEVLVDGKSVFRASYWSDFGVPETILTESAEPGGSLELLIRVDNPGSNGINDRFEVTLDIERVEEHVFALETFLHEIAYCDSVTRSIARREPQI